MTVPLLVGLVVLLTVALIIVVAVAYWRERRLHGVIADLLDRVMARSYGEYIQGTRAAAPPRVKRRPLTDPELAELEKISRHEIGVELVRQG